MKPCKKYGHDTKTRAVAHAISLRKKLHTKLCRIKTYLCKCGKWHVGRNRFDKMNEIYAIIGEQAAKEDGG